MSCRFAGSGHVALRALLVASARFGDFSPHLNVGHALRTGAGRADAALVNAGFDQPVATWATLAVDILSEWQLGGALKLPGAVQYQYPIERTLIPTSIPTMKDHRVNGAIGMKFRTRGGPILVANALVPMRRGGLESRFVWTVGIDGNFQRPTSPTGGGPTAAVLDRPR